MSSLCSGIFHKDLILKKVRKLMVLIVTKTNTEPEFSLLGSSHRLCFAFQSATYESFLQVNKVF